MSSYEATFVSRLLQFVRGDTNFPMLVRAFAVRTEGNLALMASLQEELDIETATGHRLDIIGDIVQVPRTGLSDDRYRDLLRIQIRLILSTAGNATGIIDVAEIWTNATAGYYEVYPAAVVVTVEEDPSETAYLMSLLRAAKPGGVRLIALISEDDGSGMICDSVGPGGAIAGAGLTDSVGPGGAVTGAGTVAHVRVI